MGIILGSCLNLSLAQGIQGKVTLTGTASVFTTGHAVKLSWTASPGASSYSIYRGTTAGGPYAKIASGILETNYTDLQITHKKTLYYTITAVSSNNESGYSNETIALIP